MFIRLLMLCLIPVSMFAQSSDWKLVWQEEFNYKGIPDPTIWGYEHGQSIRNNESQYYTSSRIENATVDQGTLKLIARKEPFDGKQENYTSASVITKGTKEFSYGRIEVSAILPEGRGIWPAIWLLPSEDYYGGWPRSGEIDIMEFVGFDRDKVHFNVHNEAHNYKTKGSRGTSVETRHLHDKFHVYTLEWTPAKLDFFIDDVKTFTYEKEADKHEVWPFDRPFYLILNVAIGGGWGGQQGVDDSIFPQSMVVDYVRLFQKDKY